MPDHFHALISFGMATTMKKCISSFKRYLATKCGVVWQRDFFDHRLRNDENHEEKASYILNNPVRKNLCANTEDWPWMIRYIHGRACSPSTPRNVTALSVKAPYLGGDIRQETSSILQK